MSLVELLVECSKNRLDNERDSRDRPQTQEMLYPTILTALGDFSRGLAYLHDWDVLIDIKPAKITVADSRRLLWADFNIVRNLHDAAHSRTLRDLESSNAMLPQRLWT